MDLVGDQAVAHGVGYVKRQARMSKSDLEPFGGVVIAFMFGCALIGAVSFFVVAKKSEMFFVGGRSLNAT